MSFLSIFQGRTVAKYVGETYTTERLGMFQRLRAAWELVREADKRYAASRALLPVGSMVACSCDERGIACPHDFGKPALEALSTETNTLKTQVIVTPTANGWIVSPYVGGGTPETAIVVEGNATTGRQPEDVARLLGQAVVKLSETPATHVAPTQPAQ